MYFKKIIGNIKDTVRAFKLKIPENLRISQPQKKITGPKTKKKMLFTNKIDLTICFVIVP